MKYKHDDVDSLLIWLYITIDNVNTQTELHLYTERFSNNRLPCFSDNELFTCAIFSEMLGFHNKNQVMNTSGVIIRTDFHCCQVTKFIRES